VSFSSLTVLFLYILTSWFSSFFSFLFFSLFFSLKNLMLIVAPGEFGSFFDEVVMNIREENADSPQRIGAIIAETAATRNVTVDMSRLPAEAAALLGPPPAE